MVSRKSSHLLWPCVPACWSTSVRSCCWSYNPSRSRKSAWFGLLPFRSPLLRESRLISSRRATEMFQFTHCPPSLPMCSAGGLQTSLWRGCPIGNLRAHRLHAAPPERFAGLRVLLRPSAPRHPPCPLCSLFSPTRWSACRVHGVGLTSWCLRCSSASVLQACSRQNRSYPFQLFRYPRVTPTPEEWKVAPAPGRAPARSSYPLDLGWRSSGEEPRRP